MSEETKKTAEAPEQEAKETEAAPQEAPETAAAPEKEAEAEPADAAAHGSGVRELPQALHPRG